MIRRSRGATGISLRTLAIPLLALACVAGALLVVRGLEAQATATRGAESRLLALRLDVMQLRDLPWDAVAGSGVTPAAARGELTGAVGAVETSLARLERSPGLPEDANIRAHLRPANRALWTVLDAVARGDEDTADRASDAAARHIYAMEGVMKRAAAEYRARSARAHARAWTGVVAVILLLFAAFAWFYTRAVRRRRRAEALAEENRLLLAESHAAVDTLRRSEAARARLLEATVTAAEEERVRLAVDLHDGPVQQLTALALRLDLAARRLLRGDLAKATAGLEDARGDVAAQIGALRRLMVELRPPVLDQVGLEAALREYVAGFAGRVAARCEFTGGLGECRLSPAVETTLYRVAQEALANVAKHADAHVIRVSLAADGRSVRLRVEDDGAGFEERPEADLLHDGHFGLVGLRERVERAGGAWRLTTSPGEGTVIEAFVPLEPPADALEPAEQAA